MATPWLLFALGAAFFWTVGRTLGMSRSTTGALTLTGAMANTSFVGIPMIGAAIVAMDHDLDPALVTLMVGIGVPLTFATLPVWWWLLQGYG